MQTLPEIAAYVERVLLHELFQHLAATPFR